MTQNPNWSRDEHILALDFYMRHRPSIPGKNSPEIADLSLELNQLQKHLGGSRNNTFRNVNGVYMKCSNFKRFDPDYRGKGLEHGNKDEETVWVLYAKNVGELRMIASAIRSFSSHPIPPTIDDISDDYKADEGSLLTRIHTMRERNAKLVKLKKENFLKEHSHLFCEACEFDFSDRYGPRGEGFIECHHTKPVSELKHGQKTKLTDLVLLCSNCHRMVHRKRPWWTIEELMSRII